MLGFEPLNVRPGAHVVTVKGRALPRGRSGWSLKSIPLFCGYLSVGKLYKCPLHFPRMSSLVLLPPLSLIPTPVGLAEVPLSLYLPTCIMMLTQLSEQMSALI
jgi:hypothetical protein